MSGGGRKRERSGHRNPRKHKQKKQQHLRTAEEELEAKCGFDVFSKGESSRLGCYCNDCRDLDLSRDSSLLSQEWCFAVPQWGQPYPLDVIENALLQIVRQRERIYHLQDLVCSRFNQVKGAHLTEQCTCGGTFRCKEDASEFRARMHIFSTIALHQKFQLLQECFSWILEAPNFMWGTTFSTVRPPLEILRQDCGDFDGQSVVMSA